MSSARAAVQLLARVLRGLGPGDFSVEIAVSDFHVGDLSEPRATATGGVPFPILRTRSFGLSGEGDFDAGWLLGRSCGGRGEIGTLSRTIPSGMSSPSSSSHSSSSSNVDLRLFDCQLLRLGLAISFGSLGSRCKFGLLLRRRGTKADVDERGPRFRGGSGLEYGSGRTPRLVVRTLTPWLWVFKDGSEGRFLGTDRMSRTCILLRSFECGGLVTEAALCLGCRVS